MSRPEEKPGETPRSTFRLPEDSLKKLDELVRDFASESGRNENRTTVLLQLIHREHVRRAKKETKK